MMMSGVGDRVAQRRDTTGCGHNAPSAVRYLSDTDIVRASKRQHPVQGSGSECNLGRLGSVGARSKGIANQRLYRSIDTTTLGRRLWPLAFATPSCRFGDHLQMAVALCRCSVAQFVTRYRGLGMWWRCSAWYLNGTAENSREANELPHACRRPFTRNQARLHATRSHAR